MGNSLNKETTLVEALVYASRYARNAEQLEGRRLFPTTAIVTRNDDPEFRRRIKVADASYGGKIESEWLNPVRTTESNDPPLPKVGQLVLVMFADGDPERGYYLTLMPDTNPSRDKENPENDHSELIEGNRSIDIGGSETITIENNQDVLIGAEHKISVAGDSNIKSESSIIGRANEVIDISCGLSLSLRTDSGASITLTNTGHAIIQDAFGRKITLGGIQNEWSLAGGSLNIVNASDVKINGKSIVVVDGKDTRNDTIIYRGY